jgi:hypothetical protein
MTMFEQDDYRWRETYFVLFDAKQRPRAEAVKKLLQSLNSGFEFKDATTDDDGRIESLTIVSPADYAAIDISYLDGEEVQEQALELAKEMKAGAIDAQERKKIDTLTRYNARFDVMHFSQVVEDEPDDDDVFDPSGLLVVLEALTDLTHGVGVDPASGAVLT